MEAKELRIGNYYNSHGTFKKVTPNTIEELFESKNRTWIQPIPLTEEILLKCGFIKEKEENKQFYQCYNKGNFQIHEDKGNFYYTAQWWVKLKHLHSIQNLFFALTGEELEINL